MAIPVAFAVAVGVAIIITVATTAATTAAVTTAHCCHRLCCGGTVVNAIVTNTALTLPLLPAAAAQEEDNCARVANVMMKPQNEVETNDS